MKGDGSERAAAETAAGAVWEEGAASRAAQREKKRMAVLSTGARLFTQQGYDRTSLDDIAQALGVSKRTIYYYVENKEDIMRACAALAFKWLEGPAAEAEDRGLPPLERLQRFMRGYMRMLVSDFGACMVAAREFPLSDEAREAVFTGVRRTDALIRSLIREGIEDGSMAECDPAYAAAALFGAFNWSIRWLPRSDIAEPDQAADKLLAPIIEGLRKR